MNEFLLLLLPLLLSYAAFAGNVFISAYDRGGQIIAGSSTMKGFEKSIQLINFTELLEVNADAATGQSSRVRVKPFQLYKELDKSSGALRQYAFTQQRLKMVSVVFVKTGATQSQVVWKLEMLNVNILSSSTFCDGSTFIEKITLMPATMKYSYNIPNSAGIIGPSFSFGWNIFGNIPV